MSVERIERCFTRLRSAGKTALIPYVTIGEPSVEDSLACARAALEAGADLLELGVPFSDPTADGPVIAAASFRAIQRGGSLRAGLHVASELRKQSDAPLVLFTYYNPVLAYGDERLPRAAADAGVDALLIVDLPPEEGSALRDAADAAGIAIIPLVAPTSGPDREARLFARAKGFVYYVSVTGVTGAAAAPLQSAGRDAAALQKRANLPVVVGFGIRSAEDARIVAREGVAGVVVGTEIMRTIAAASNLDARAGGVRSLIAGLRQGLDAR